MTAEQCRKLSGLIAYEKCFIAPVLSANRSINYTDARKACKHNKTLLAEIHDATQQTRIHDFLYSKMPSGLTHFYVWIGMKNNYQVRTRNTTLKDCYVSAVTALEIVEGRNRAKGLIS